MENENAIKRAEARFMCARVCELYDLSPESTKFSLAAVAERTHGAWSCYKAILNSFTWEGR